MLKGASVELVLVWIPLGRSGVVEQELRWSPVEGDSERNRNKQQKMGKSL